MDDQTALLPEPTRYEKLVKAGVDMSWYDRAKSKRLPSLRNDKIPLMDEKCCSLSIYLLKKDGSLWTIQRNGEPYQQVREGSKKLPHATLVCVCCKKQFKNIKSAQAHDSGSQ